MFNSTATIFTMDIYKQHINKDAADKKLVHIGRWVAFISLVIALIAVRPLLGGLDQAFQYIQEYSGFIYPGILVVFGLGLLWKRASGSAAVWTSIATIPAGVFFKVAFPDMPFQFRMGFVFLVLLGMFIALTYTDKKARATALPSEKDIKVMLKWSNIAAIVGVITLIASFVVLFGGDSTPTFEYLNNLGFPSAFLCFTGFMIFIAVFLRSNAKDTVEDPKRVAVDLNLFRTDIGFGLGSLGIFAILAFLYTIFW
jgi:SSS family solute:Na+ symporter